MNQSINVLGTNYEIIVKKCDDDKAFQQKNICGYCDAYLKQIVVCDPKTFAGWEHEDRKTVTTALNESIRHEIIHAFLSESGLGNGSLQNDGGWAKNEEMIDWFALQGQKIYIAWQHAGAAE